MPRDEIIPREVAEEVRRILGAGPWAYRALIIAATPSPYEAVRLLFNAGYRRRALDLKWSPRHAA